jgi:hypothetical protein
VAFTVRIQNAPWESERLVGHFTAHHIEATQTHSSCSLDLVENVPSSGQSFVDSDLVGETTLPSDLDTLTLTSDGVLQLTDAMDPVIIGRIRVLISQDNDAAQLNPNVIDNANVSLELNFRIAPIQLGEVPEDSTSDTQVFRRTLVYDFRSGKWTGQASNLSQVVPIRLANSSLKVRYVGIYQDGNLLLHQALPPSSHQSLQVVPVLRNRKSSLQVVHNSRPVFAFPTPLSSDGNLDPGTSDEGALTSFIGTLESLVDGAEEAFVELRDVSDDTTALIHYLDRFWILILVILSLVVAVLVISSCVYIRYRMTQSLTASAPSRVA